jgi:hypothetical protein
MTNDKDSAVIKSRLAAVNWELPGMEKFSKDDIAFFKREIGHEKGGIVKNLHSLGWSYWPIANRGYLDHRLLRVIADFIEIQNKPFWDDYEAMNAEEDAFRASQPTQSDGLREALEGVLPYVLTNYFRCNGDKCRHPTCASCFGEDFAESQSDKANLALTKAKAAIAALQEQSK